MIRFEPRLWICSATRACAPAPTPTIAITAPTPMMMPSIVSALRSLLTRSARIAIRTLCQAFTLAISGQTALARRSAYGDQRREGEIATHDPSSPLVSWLVARNTLVTSE